LLNEQEISDILPKIEAVLSYAARVQELAPTKQVAPDTYKTKNVTRDDIIIPSNPAVLLADAPRTEGNYFFVPAIIKQG
jgi:Asp-tRNA(Asn)/Glu-tRNA(Gln) amidotransferase C subunit